MNALTDLLRPIFDARLVLGVYIVHAATGMALDGRISPEAWGVAVTAATAWLTTAPRASTAGAVEAKSRGI